MIMKQYERLTAAFCTIALTWASAALAGTGLLYERYSEAGSADSMLYETQPADYTEIVTSAQWGIGDDNAIENYRARLTGWIIPQVTGAYRFYLNSDDNGRVWLSANGVLNTATLLCVETDSRGENNWAGPGEEEVSVEVMLDAGKAYWLRAGMQEGGGGDHIQVGWTCAAAGINTPTVIASQYLFTANPYLAVNPTPANGAVDVALDSSLTWTAGSYDKISGYYVYCGQDPNLVALGASAYRGFKPLGSESYTPSGDIALALDRHYYWRIDESVAGSAAGDPNTIIGPVWSFKTVRTIPDILTQPQNVVVAAGGLDARFAMDIYNPITGDATGLTYAWKKTGDPTVISTNPVLIFTHLTDANEGAYTCTVTNANGSRASEPATLEVVNKVVHWTFDETNGSTAADASGNAFNGTVGAGALWIADGGQSGQAGDGAIRLPGLTTANVQATNVNLTGKPVNDIFKGNSSWTINLWVKIGQVPMTEMMGGFGDCYFVDGNGMTDRYFNWWEGGSVEFNYGDWGLWPGTTPSLNEWHMLTSTYNGATTRLTMYIDGAVVATSLVTLGDVTEHAFKLGTGYVAWSDAANLHPVNAIFDDFCIYDGAITQGDVDYMYGGWTCAGTLPMDFNGDCTVGLPDLAILLEQWMVNHAVE